MNAFLTELSTTMRGGFRGMETVMSVDKHLLRVTTTVDFTPQKPLRQSMMSNTLKDNKPPPEERLGWMGALFDCHAGLVLLHTCQTLCTPHWGELCHSHMMSRAQNTDTDYWLYFSMFFLCWMIIFSFQALIIKNFSVSIFSCLPWIILYVYRSHRTHCDA